MTCRTIEQGIRDRSRTLEEMYSALGVLPATTGEGMAPPTTFLPPNVAVGQLPYLTGADHRSFNLAPLYASGEESLRCLLNQAGYDDARARQIAAEVEALPAGERDAHVASMTVLDQRIYNIFKTLRVIEYFRTDGNKDHNPNVISADEVQNWAWEFTRHNEESYRRFGGQAIARMHALLGLAHFLGTEPPAPPSPPQTTQRPAATFGPGEEVFFAAPAGGWEGGEEIVVNGNDITSDVLDQMAYGNTNPTVIPNDYLSEGVNEIVLQRVDGSFETQQVTIRPTATTIPAPEETSSRSFLDSVGDFFSEPTVAFGAGALAAGLAAFIFLRRAFKGRSEAETKLAEETRVRTEAEAALTRARTELARVQGEFGSLGSTITAARPRIEADLPRLRDELQVKEGELGTAEGSLGRSVADANLPQEIGRVEADVSAKAGEVSRLQAQLKSRSLPRGVTKTGIRRELTRLTGEEKGNGTTGELGQARAELETLRTIARLRVEVAQWKVDIALREAGLNATDAFAALDSALNPPAPAPRPTTPPAPPPPPQSGGPAGTP